MSTYESTRVVRDYYKKYLSAFSRALRYAIVDSIGVSLRISGIIAKFALLSIEEHYFEVWQTHVLRGMMRDRWSNDSFLMHFGDPFGDFIEIILEVRNDSIAACLENRLYRIMFPARDYLYPTKLSQLVDSFTWKFRRRYVAKRMFCHEYIGQLLIRAYSEKADMLLRILHT